MPSFITSKVLAYAGGILSAILAIALTASILNGKVLEGQLKKRDDRIVALAGDLRTSRTNEATLDTALRGQNAAVDKLKTEAELAAAKAKLAQEAANLEAARYRQAAANLANAKPGPDLCASASQLIRNTLAAERGQ